MLDPKFHLDNTIIPFWTKLADMEQGGFYGFMDYDLHIIKTSDKNLVYTARMLYAFSLFGHSFKNDECHALATHAYQFLKKYRDPSHHGLVWAVDHEGHHKDLKKHLYGHVFALYGLSSYAIATNHQDVTNEALELFDVIEKHFREEPFRYYESFDQFWNRMENRLLDEYNVGACYTTNTLLHLMEAYSLLYEASQSPLVGKRLMELIDGFKDILYNQKRHGFLIAHDRDFNPIDIGQSYGHDIETVWILAEAKRRLGIRDQELEHLLLDVATHVMENALTDQGLVSDAVAGHPPRGRIWWVQAEAIVGFLEAYEMSGDIRFMDAAEKIWTFIQTYLIDPRADSEWLWGVDLAMKPNQERGIAEGWKAPYHNGRALVEMIKRGMKP